MQTTPTAKFQYLNEAGVDIMHIIGYGGNLQYGQNANGGEQVVPLTISTTTPTISGSIPAFYVVTTGSAATITVNAPVATVDDGLEIFIASNTNFAHVVAVGAGNLLAGVAAKAQVTFPAFAGAEISLTAYQGKWILATYNAATYTLA